ncbi:zinc finger, CCHC-type containing protein [Tanacetum coccineum]
MIPTKSLRRRVRSVENLVISRRIIGLRRTMVQALLDRDKGLRTQVHNKVDEIAWWIDSGATCHACKNRWWFDTFHPVEDGSVLHMGDESTKPILGRGNIGCWAIVRLPEPKNKNLGEKGIDYIFIGYAEHSKAYSIEKDPKTFDEAMKSRDHAFWKKAVDDEIGSIMENNTWVLSDLPPSCFRQKEGIDYFDTYALVARISTIRLLIALAATHNLVIHQMDVKIIFLNGDLKEEIYMKQPEGFVMPSNEHKLYKCVYCKFDKFGKGVIICLYVDDMLIFGIDQNQVDKTKEFVSLNFSIKDKGEADVILGIIIKRKNKGLTITQSYYIEKILKKFNYEGCGRVSTPMEACIKLMPCGTMSDIAYAIEKLSRFTRNPSNHQWEAIIRVSRYLKKIMNYGLSYVGFPSVTEGYFDASWITNSEDHTSTTCWVFLLGKKAEWLRNLIYEILLWPKPISHIFMHYDSAATLAKAYSQIYNGKSRHLEAEFNEENLQLKIGTHCIIPRCKTNEITYVSMECCRFKKLGLGFLYAYEGYGHKAL